MTARENGAAESSITRVELLFPTLVGVHLFRNDNDLLCDGVPFLRLLLLAPLSGEAIIVHGCRGRLWGGGDGLNPFNPSIFLRRKRKRRIDQPVIILNYTIFLQLS